MELINTPFNYTGSKFKLLPQILPIFDYDKKYFIDLFCGGGSVYTNILGKYEKVLINDKIKELVEIHRNLIKDPDNFIKSVKSICVSKEDKEGYLDLRNKFNENKSPDILWALMLSCTNNMMRFNKKLKFNQSFGKRTWNNNTDKKVEEFVSHISKYKDSIYFRSGDFSTLEVKSPSMVYLDPPYTNTEAGYNAYWSKELESKLYEYIINLNETGSSFMLSGVLGEHKNGKRSKIIDDLIKDGFNYKILDFDYEKVARNKKSKNSKEIVIYNYNV